MSLPEQLQQSDRLDPLVWKITSVAVIGSFAARCDGGQRIALEYKFVIVQPGISKSNVVAVAAK